MEINRTEKNCGIGELHGIIGNKPDAIVKFIADSVVGEGEQKRAFIIFSDIKTHAHGTALAAYIRSQHLGTVVVSDVRVNPQTNNKLKVWTWGVDWKAVKIWWASQDEDED